MATVETIIAHNWKKELHPSIKQWYAKLWSDFVMAKQTDSLKVTENKIDYLDFTVVWYAILTYMSSISEFPTDL